MVSASPPKDLTEESQWKEEVGPPRRAKWWYSTFHTVTAMVGAGVLSLPYAMAYLGWGSGVVVMILSWCITLNSMWQMIQLHECVPGVRFDRYIDLGKHAFGPKLGVWIVLPQQLIVGCDIVYMVTGGKCLKKFMEIACTNCKTIHQSYWIIIFGSSHFFLSQLPNFNSVFVISLAAAAMSLSLGGMLGKRASRERQLRVQGNKRAGLDVQSVQCAWRDHICVSRARNNTRDPSHNPFNSRQAFKKANVEGSFGRLFRECNLLLPGCLHWDVADNVLVALQRPPWLIAAANLMVVVHLPGIIWIIIKRPKRFSLSWIINWACIFIGVFVMFASTIGGLRNIVADSSTYSFYS
ncbi:LOW QUALITY PROTEIN: hypothetical protein V2J09_008718 [Rumex salicifolius]